MVSDFIEAPLSASMRSEAGETTTAFFIDGFGHPGTGQVNKGESRSILVLHSPLGSRELNELA